MPKVTSIATTAIVKIVLLFSIPCMAQPDINEGELTTDGINTLLVQNSPLHGAAIPADIGSRLGASHVAGKYYLSDAPYLIEGSKAIRDFGMGTIKVWFQETPAIDYPYRSDWDLNGRVSLVEMATHRYYKALFDMPFKTFALSVRGEIDLNQAMNASVTDYTEEEQAVYELAKHLLQTYRDRNVVFILHNWEGDWLMRGGTDAAAQWTATFFPDDVKKRSKVMINWFKARQAGISRARDEAGKTNCKVYHAIEVNKVLDGRKGIPSLASDVLPHVNTDMVSWSCYEGLADPVELWRGIDYIKEKMKPTGEFPAVPIMIGEIGIPENEGTVFGIAEENGVINKDELIKRWDMAMSVFITRDIPYIIHWQLYCNEVKAGVQKSSVYTIDQLRGFWLIRPDGTASYSASYLSSLIQNAGKKIIK